MSTHKDKEASSKFWKKIERAALPIAELIPGIDKAAAAVKALNEYYDEQKAERIKRYSEALLTWVEDVDFSTAKNLAEEIEYADLLQACINDSDGSKAEAYAQLTIAMKFGSLERDYRRHFILSLKQLTYDDLALLRLSYIATKADLISKQGNGILSTSEIFDRHRLGPIRSLSLNTLVQLGLTKPEGISDLGKTFVESVFPREKLLSHESFDVWQDPPLAILTGEKKDSYNDSVISHFKNLRIRCVQLPITSYSKSLNINDFKAVIFAGDYEGLTYGQHQELSNFTNHNTYKCINLGYRLSDSPSGMAFLHIDYEDCKAIKDKIRAVARKLNYVIDI